MRYPNLDRARRHLLRSQTAYQSSLYRHVPQRIVLGMDQHYVLNIKPDLTRIHDALAKASLLRGSTNG